MKDDTTTSDEIQVSVSENTRVLYSDSVFISSSPYGVVFDFAQSIGLTNKHEVVARLGMSKDHAEAFLKLLKEELEKEEPRVIKRIARS